MLNKQFWRLLIINISFIAILFSFWKESSSKDFHYNPVKYVSLEENLIQSTEKVLPTVVQIVAEDKQTNSLLKKGSGIVVSRSWYILTNNHVIDATDLNYFVITSKWDTFPVKKIWKDDLLDMAILSLELPNSISFSPAIFIDIDSSVSLWQFVFAIGNSLSEYPNTISLWIISWKGRSLSIDQKKTPYYAWLYQTDAALNPWNSWWPLVNLSGEVLWMVTAISRGGNNIWFALPLTQKLISTTYEILEKHQTLLRPYLGIIYTDTLTWAHIDTIFSWSPVQDNLLVWDIIIALDKRILSLEKPLLYYLYTYKPWETVIFTIKREDSIVSVPVVLWQKTL